jgi:hypothetical protein
MQYSTIYPYRTPMAHSEIYLVLKSQIEKNLLVKSLSEFNQQLERLEEEGWITREEYRELMELFIEKLRTV